MALGEYLQPSDIIIIRQGQADRAQWQEMLSRYVTDLGGERLGEQGTTTGFVKLFRVFSNSRDSKQLVDHPGVLPRVLTHV